MFEISPLLPPPPQVPQAVAYPGFCNTKWLGLFLLPPRCNYSPLHGYQDQHCWYPFAHLGGESWVTVRVMPRKTTQCPKPGIKPRQLDRKISTRNMRPPCLTSSSVITFKVSTVRCRPSFLVALLCVLFVCLFVSKRNLKANRNVELG